MSPAIAPTIFFAQRDLGSDQHQHDSNSVQGRGFRNWSSEGWTFSPTRNMGPSQSGDGKYL